MLQLENSLLWMSGNSRKGGGQSGSGYLNFSTLCRRLLSCIPLERQPQKRSREPRSERWVERLSCIPREKPHASLRTRGSFRAVTPALPAPPGQRQTKNCHERRLGALNCEILSQSRVLSRGALTLRFRRTWFGVDDEFYVSRNQDTSPRSVLRAFIQIELTAKLH